ncbi:MAG: Rpn family recombination-promoting nuclease/putative transposase, partial [Myxococcales bacterium]|nr:Rpn family recombination-promoting nuclease/putative transposase [Myxococcales bacterium]
MSVTATPDDIVLTHSIDPWVDVVFKALFGSPAHTDLLVDFLNAILRPETPIVGVQLADPAGERLGTADKAVTLDVKARDASGRAFNVELQRWRHPALAERALYYWSSLYNGQITQGEGYADLAPAVSIWIVGEPLWPDQGPHLHFELREVHAGLRLTDHCAIHFLQPRRWTGTAESAATGEEAWLCFFRDAAHWTRLPPPLTTSDSMRQAMAVLRQFSEVELDRLAYIARRDKELLQQTMTNALARAERALNEERQRAEEERQRAEEERQRAEE